MMREFLLLFFFCSVFHSLSLTRLGGEVTTSRWRHRVASPLIHSTNLIPFLTNSRSKLNRYPARMIPGIDITCCTTATNDKDARLLLSSMGVPFHGKHVN